MSISIKIICYKYKILSNGESPLMIQIIKDRKRSMKSLGISIHPSNWDFDKHLPKPSCPNKEEIIQLILKTKIEYQKKLLDKTNNDEAFTSASLIQENSKKLSTQTVEEFYQFIISDLRKSGNIGNSYVYINSLNSIKKFNDGKTISFTFSKIDVAYLVKYEAWLRGIGNKETTISFLFRTLRAAYNRAILSKLIGKDNNPFGEFKVSKFNVKTTKRALSKQDMMRIIHLDTSSYGYGKKLAHHIFVFSYLCGGMSFVDLASLKSDNIIDGRLLYNRQKTDGAINLVLSDRAMEIIDYYSNGSEQSGYLFPILDKNIHLTKIQQRTRVNKVCYNVNKNLKLIAMELGLNVNLTTYVARHSFATVLKKSGVDIGLISEALGHMDMNTTRIYLDSFDNSQVDEAMKFLV
jgi:site-specific recombinase XerD